MLSAIQQIVHLKRWSACWTDERRRSPIAQDGGAVAGAGQLGRTRSTRSSARIPAICSAQHFSRTYVLTYRVTHNNNGGPFTFYLSFRWVFVWQI